MQVITLACAATRVRQQRQASNLWHTICFPHGNVIEQIVLLFHNKRILNGRQLLRCVQTAIVARWCVGFHFFVTTGATGTRAAHQTKKIQRFKNCSSCGFFFGFFYANAKVDCVSSAANNSNEVRSARFAHNAHSSGSTSDRCNSASDTFVSSGASLSPWHHVGSCVPLDTRFWADTWQAFCFLRDSRESAATVANWP